VKTFLIATRNAHKVGEIRAILGGEFQFLTLNDFPGAPAVIEDAATFAGNATKKAVQLAEWIAGSPAKFESGEFWVLADDSGLEVDALNGAPGVHSARFAAVDHLKDGNTPDADNNAKLLRLLHDVSAEKRTARFRCLIAITPVTREPTNASPVCYAQGEPLVGLFDGACDGRIEFAPRGQGGFGYDPLFVPNGFEQSFAELGEVTKNQLSHRAQALGKLKQWLAEGRQLIA
jgi:XTP/dITP diphosphohydrolase